MDYRTWPNLARMLFDQVERQGDKPFLWAKRDGAWRGTSYRQAGGAVRRLAAALRAIGVAPGDRVALVAENRPEWVIADFAIMAAGAITVPAYITSTVDDYRHVLSNSGAKGAIVSTRALADKVLPAARGTPSCGFVVGMEALPGASADGPLVHDWAELIDRAPADTMPEAVAGLSRADLACIIYTSGTGGLPKGVALTHGNILTNCRGAYELLLKLGLGDETFLSFLPLSHSYEHTAGECFPIGLGAQIYFAEGADALARNLVEARPTIMTAVPRLYETMHLRMASAIKREGGLKAKLFWTAVALGRKRYQRPQEMTLADRLADAVVERLVRDKVRARFGGRLKALVSGGAPLNPDIGLFFTALGLTLLQGYGQTETSPVVSCNPTDRVKLDTVGPPLVDVEVKIAEDGEILVRGPLVMAGYWNDPAATAATVRDGWVYTGDVGLIDADGYIMITDRKKDFIKNSGGDMIAPARVEGLLTLEPEIAQALVYGDRRPHLVAVIVPREETAKVWAAANGKPAELPALAADAGFRATIDAAVERVNVRLQPVERVRRFILAREPFTVANEMMTPTLKVRRHKVRETYGTALEGLYR
ncbi:MAG: long-chain fatty acid--CoA ligase [Proteobacteria bacterium]|nr:long-chain fatty acid--CoA ligase [Pseudomonadota bacterium]